VDIIARDIVSPDDLKQAVHGAAEVHILEGLAKPPVSPRLRNPRRLQFVWSQLAVAVLVQPSQRGRCVGNFTRVEHAIVIGVKGFHQYYSDGILGIAGPGRPQLIWSQPAIPVPVESLQGSRCIRDFTSVNHPVVITIQGLHQGALGWAGTVPPETWERGVLGVQGEGQASEGQERQYRVSFHIVLISLAHIVPSIPHCYSTFMVS